MTLFRLYNLKSLLPFIQINNSILMITVCFRERETLSEIICCLSGFLLCPQTLHIPIIPCPYLQFLSHFVKITLKLISSLAIHTSSSILFSSSPFRTNFLKELPIYSCYLLIYQSIVYLPPSSLFSIELFTDTTNQSPSIEISQY